MTLLRLYDVVTQNLFERNACKDVYQVDNGSGVEDGVGSQKRQLQAVVVTGVFEQNIPSDLKIQVYYKKQKALAKYRKGLKYLLQGYKGTAQTP